MRKLVLFAATGAGSGYAPVAPGTVGSALGLAIWSLARELSAPAYLGLVAAVLAGGAWCAHRAEAIFGSKDDGRITIDEVAGMLLSLALLPTTASAALVGAAGFVLFRIFDIAKPPPALRGEALPGGIGVMADDVVAALYANACGQVLWRVLWPGLGS